MLLLDDTLFKDKLSAVVSKGSLDTLIRILCFSHISAEWEGKMMTCHAISYTKNNTGHSSSFVKVTVRIRMWVTGGQR